MSQTADVETYMTLVMTKVIENIGSNIGEVKYELSESTDHMCFNSNMFKVCVRFYDNTHGRHEKLALVLKKPTKLVERRQNNDSDSQFHNEIIFYQMYAQPGDNLPKCIYCDLRSPVDSVIALEDVTERGYRVCPYSYDVPLDYTLAAMREIARFHGKGYVMKEFAREKFFNIAERFQEIRYHATTGRGNYFESLIDIVSTRAVNYLRNHDHDVVFCDKMQLLLSNAYQEVMLKTIEKVEPLSTLCHGDFTLSNMLFKTGDDGQHQVMLIDFALMRYATPVIDLSTYLSLCCSNEVRRDKFSEILKTYHDTLKEYLLEAGVQNIEKYSYDALLNDYRRGALFGFVIASFFLPILHGKLHPSKVVFSEQEWDEVITLTKESGGDEISEMLAEMLLHLKDLGCLNM